MSLFLVLPLLLKMSLVLLLLLLKRNLQVCYSLFKKTNNIRINNSLLKWAGSWQDKTLTSQIETILCQQFSAVSSNQFDENKEDIIKSLKKLDNVVFYIFHR